MSALPRSAPMTLAEFLAWEEGQEHKHEFVDGRIAAMAGASMIHNRIAANVISSLHGKLKGKPCQPYGSDAKFISPTDRSRYPDVQVDCGPLRPGELSTTDPRVVVEVLSASNDWLDVAERQADFQAHPSVAHILLISSERQRAQLLTRDGAVWREEVLSGLDGGFDLAAIETRLEMAEIFEGVTFGPAE
jgi:Uma2 family endonuclease